MFDTEVSTHDGCIEVELAWRTEGAMHVQHGVFGTFRIVTPHRFVAVLRAFNTYTGVCLQNKQK